MFPTIRLTRYMRVLYNKYVCQNSTTVAKPEEVHMPYTHIHKGDLIVLCAVLLFAAGLFLFPHLTRTADGAYCEIFCGGTITRYSLTDERTIPITHGGYTLSVTIANGAVSVTSADCPDRVCVKTGAIATVGSVIVCIPAEVIVRIGGMEEADYVAG